MGATGAWVVGVIPDAAARELAQRYGHPVGPGHGDPSPEVGRVLAWWRNGGGEESYFARRTDPSDPLEPTPAAYRFADLVEAAHASSDTADTDAMRDASTALMPEAVGTGLFVATARKANPVAALYHGLGPRRSALLPGWFGHVLLSADEVRAALPRYEEALLLPDGERAAVLSRIADWMTAMGDAPDADAAELVDGPLRVVRHAAAAGSGVAAFSNWY
ncbi:hypothetical protein [Streptomyces sp. CC210A]|uniref:hypothetical protein n=1 Tax=Streptomyces sp. CC210A TaxID=2898184 RepID=UPI001F277350|nr:hypothetical protein [Streptomyces sp. CC210A]